MTKRPVDAIFFWPLTKDSVFKPVYGRAPKDPPPGTRAEYTKDYLQPTQHMSSELEKVLGKVPASGDLRVDWQWPGGGDPDGALRHHDAGGVRLDLDWSTTIGAPKPWRLHPNPSEATIETLQGDLALVTINNANAELDRIRGSDERPWLIAVHCFGDGAVFHPRVVLENPRPGREYASWDSLPAVVRSDMSALAANQVMGVSKFTSMGYAVRAQKIVDQVLDAFESTPNVLLVGPPGTGKTVAMEDIRESFVSGEGITFDTTRLHRAFDTSGSLPSVPTQVRSLVFHPSYTYEDFVLGLLPEVAPGGAGVAVAPRVGPLLEMAHFASQPGQRALVVCDEFNRGAAASIFGDTLALLDSDKRSDAAAGVAGAVIETPYHHLAPKTHSSGTPLDPQTSLPSSLYVLAAMNSADRSVAPLDAALRRRFAIIYVGPDYELLRGHLDIPSSFVKDDKTDPGDSATWTTVDHVTAVAVAILEALNDRIEAVLGRDFVLGHSVMWKVGGTDVSAAFKSLATALDNNVLGTLTLSFTDNDADLAAVLNADPGGTDLPNAAATWHAPPGRTSEVAGSRLRPVRFRDLSGQDLVETLASML